MGNTFTRRARIVSAAAGFTVAAGLTFGGPFIHPPVQDTPAASASAADRARCVLSLVDFVEGDCTDVFKPAGRPDAVPGPGGHGKQDKEPVVDRRETFDWI
ncbi:MULTISPECIES: hypothetical protein [unclassified Streptomyces]|uniref:hypothetical protein n=1 Tax=unclassified Streptomyces TaxID=2593676 RepID=UPI002E362051|nr:MULTISPECIES: hypothetical protein [unclassified Streptomyces]WUC65719.1 hypothetical protein OG861_16560 [Streptomyces sp. NBC_00539]